MKLSELRKFIDNELSTRLEYQKFKKYNFGFFTSSGEFTIAIGYSTVDSDNSFLTSFSLSAGFPFIDKVLYAIKGDIEEMRKVKVGTQIFVRQVVLFEENKFKQENFDIYNLEGARKATNEIVTYFTNEFIPEINHYKDIKSLESYINSKEHFEFLQKYSNRLLYDLQCGLILAKIVNNPNYETLKLKFSNLLIEWSEWQRKEFDLVANFIETNSSSDLSKLIETLKVSKHYN